jgi:SAM-dependent methyltransferase
MVRSPRIVPDAGGTSQSLDSRTSTLPESAKGQPPAWGMFLWAPHWARGSLGRTRPSRSRLGGRIGEPAGISGQIDIYLFDQLLKGRSSPGMRILDAGCGSGRNIVYLLRGGYEVYGADSDAESLESVRSLACMFAPALPASDFRVEPVEHMSLDDACADVVISSTILHLAADGGGVPSRMRRYPRLSQWSAVFPCLCDVACEQVLNATSTQGPAARSRKLGHSFGDCSRALAHALPKGLRARACQIGAVKPPSRRMGRLNRHRRPYGKKTHFSHVGAGELRRAAGSILEARQLPDAPSLGRDPCPERLSRSNRLVPGDVSNHRAS